VDKIKGLFFDVGGTVFDWKSTAIEKVNKIAQSKGLTLDTTAFADDWRREMFKILGQVRYGNLPWMNSDEMLVRAFKNLISSYPDLDKIHPMSLIESTWHRLIAFPGAAEAINRLKTQYHVVVLTILSYKSIVNSSKAAGVNWDGIISCEFLGCYKPSLQAYLKGVALLGYEPEEAMMVAAHEDDLEAAQAAGLHTAFVRVPVKDMGFGSTEQSKSTGFDIEATDFEELCRKLGCRSN
jgi:2-haloacid dehalogenase